METDLKERAVALRKQGLSYREIMEQIPVAKSTLSDWLHSVGLARHQKQRLTEKKLASARRGGAAKRRKRIERQQEIMEFAESEVGAINQREFWIIGIMLYWAEGSKEKEYRPGSRVQFTNSDADMICLFLRWLKEFFDKGLADITLDLYIHTLHKGRTEEIITFWSDVIGCDPSCFKHIYYKKGNPKTLRKNVGETYHGVLKVNVKASSALQRRIAGWTRGVVKSIR